MDKITYSHDTTDRVTVYLAGRHVGVIRQQKDGQWQYFPKGQKTGGEKFPTLAQCKRSVEGADESESNDMATAGAASSAAFPATIPLPGYGVGWN